MKRFRPLLVVALLFVGGLAFAQGLGGPIINGITETLADLRYLMLSGGTIVGAVNSTSTIQARGITSNNATATDDQIAMAPTTGGAARFTGTLSALDLTANRTWKGPNADVTMNAAADISGATLASNVLASSLTSVGALNAGSITSGFGAIDVGAAAISGGAGTFTSQLKTTANPASTANTSAALLSYPSACDTGDHLFAVLTTDAATKLYVNCAGTVVVSGTTASGYFQVTGGNPYVDLYQTAFGHFYLQNYTNETGGAASGNYTALLNPSGKHFTFTHGSTQLLEINSTGTGNTKIIGQFAPGSTPQTQTCADVAGSGTSSVTVNPTSATVVITNNDVLGGCVATVAESNAVASSRVTIFIDITSQATMVTFADQTGLFAGNASHLTGMLPGNSFDMAYINSQWNAVTDVVVNGL